MRIYPAGTRIKHKKNIGEIVKYDDNIKKWEIKWISFSDNPVQGWVGWLKDSEIELETPIPLPKLKIKPIVELTTRRK